MFTAEEIKLLMQEHSAMWLHELSTEALREAGCMDQVAVLPKDFNERARYLANVLVQMLSRKPEDERLRATVSMLTQALSYLMNSTSWQDQVLYDFDSANLKRKVQYLPSGVVR